MKMVSEELVNWVKNAKTKGYSNDQLRQYLSSKGYDESTIQQLLASDQPQPTVSSSDQDLINSIASESDEAAPKKSIKMPKMNIKAILYAVGIIVAAVFVFFTFGQSSVACEANLECNDGLSTTYDICINPGLANAQCINAPERQLSLGVSSDVTLSIGESLAFDTGSDTYVLILDKVGTTLAQASVYLPRRTLALSVGRAAVVDINKDSIADIQITANSLGVGTANFRLNVVG